MPKHIITGNEEHELNDQTLVKVEERLIKKRFKRQNIKADLRKSLYFTHV